MDWYERFTDYYIEQHCFEDALRMKWCKVTLMQRGAYQ